MAPTELTNGSNGFNAEVSEEGRYWYVEGEKYDLTDWLAKHPGGPDFLVWCRGRDITILVHSYHRDPLKTVLPILKRYKVTTNGSATNGTITNNGHGEQPLVKKKLGIPFFLLPDDFDATRDLPRYDFNPDNKDLLLNTARKAILAPEAQAAIRRLDWIFDSVVLLLLVSYMLLVFMWLTGHVAWWIAVPAFALLRTSLAGGGHYYLHRGKPHPGDALFDINYVGTCFVTQDGHVLIHHAYTLSDADIKRGFFGGMMGVPRLWRPLVHTLHKIGHVTSGMIIRGYEVEVETEGASSQGAQRFLRAMFPKRTPVHVAFWLLHLTLRVEMLCAMWAGVGGAWVLQFLTTLWINTLMVVASHDFTEVVDKECKDWARYQLLNSHDMSVVGNPWLDCFLSAGLSPHRAHHIFPYQKSGFANIYSNSHLAVAAKQHGLPWLQPKSFFTEILPVVFRMYIWSPVRERTGHSPKARYSSFLAEHLDPACYSYMLGYIWSGFLGIGSL